MKTFLGIIIELTLAAIFTTVEAQNTNGEAGQRLVTSHELPNQYWTDLVTEQPEGYVVDGNGNVHLHSAEALAWLISTVNGLNGQEADDFNGKKVTLEANVDMSEAIWVPIADGTNLGDPNPDRLKFCGTFDGNGAVVNGLILSNNPFYYGNFEGFFGNLCGARIENVVLRHVYSEGRNERDGKFFGNAEPLETGTETRHTVINQCYVEIDEMRKSGQNRESALFGYKNEGVITNCMVKLDKLSYPGSVPESEGLFVYDNRGTIQNCASVADSLKWLHNFGGMANDNYGKIENCYSFIGTWFGDYQAWWPPIPRLGVCVNNFGTIKNCYYNKFDPDGFSNVPAYTNQGVINNTESFFKTDDWVLDNPVGIQGENGVVYETANLLEALNYWVLGQGNGDAYMTWCENGGLGENNLPVLCDLDITNVSENKNANDVISVSPNPTTGQITVTGESLRHAEAVNVLGQRVATATGEGNRLTIDLGGLPASVYFVNITDEDGRKCVRKVVKE